MSKNDKVRTDVHLDVILDADILADIEQSGMQRATYFKHVAREAMRHREEEQFDERVKRLLNDVLAQRGEIKPVTKVESKSRLGFGAKRASDTATE